MTTTIPVETVITARDNASAVFANLGKNTTGLSKKMAGLASVAAGVGASFSFASLKSAFIDPAMKAETAIKDLSKVTGEMSFEQLDDLKRKAEDVAIAMGRTTESVLEAMGEAKRGDFQGDLLGFAERSAMIASAWKVADSSAADFLTKTQGRMKISETETYELADAVNMLANRYAGLTESNLSQTIIDVAATGRNFGFTALETAAYAASLTSITGKSDKAKTAFNGMFTTLKLGTNLQEKQKKVLKDLGLDYAALPAQIEANASGTVRNLLGLLAKVDKAQQLAVITTLFGREAAPGVLGMIGNLEELDKGLNAIRDKKAFAGSVIEEFTKGKDTAALVRSNGEAWDTLARTLGEGLRPAYASILRASIAFKVELIDLVRRFPDVANGALQVAAVIGTGGPLLISARLAAFALGVNGMFGSALKGLGSMLLTTLPNALGVAVSAFRVAGVAIATSPLGLAVVGLAAAGALVVRYWEPLKAFFSGLWEGISTGLAPLMPLLEPLKNLGGKILTAWESVSPLFAGVGDALSGVFEWVGKLFEPFEASEKQLTAWSDAGRVAGETVAAGVVAIVDGINLAFTTVRNFVETFDLADAAKTMFETMLAPLNAIIARIKEGFAGLSFLNPFGDSNESENVGPLPSPDFRDNVPALPFRGGADLADDVGPFPAPDFGSNVIPALPFRGGADLARADGERVAGRAGVANAEAALVDGGSSGAALARIEQAVTGGASGSGGAGGVAGGIGPRGPIGEGQVNIDVNVTHDDVDVRTRSRAGGGLGRVTTRQTVNTGSVIGDFTR